MQFSLRTLLIVMLLGGPMLAGLLWIGREVNWAAACLALISGLGGGLVGGIAAGSIARQKN